MSQNEIKVGDQVKLKSGGPAMTVGRVEKGTTVSDEDTALCYFWVENTPDGKHIEQSFPVKTLQITT